MQNRLSLYPMTKDMCAIARYSNMLQNYSLYGLYSPSFSGLNGEDINTIDGGILSNYQLSDYSTDANIMNDTILLDYDENMKDVSIYSDALCAAKNQYRDVIISRKLDNILHLGTHSTATNIAFSEKPEIDRLYDFSIPVITILSQGARTDQFATELALRTHFIKEGYRVSQVSSFDGSTFLGFPSLPSFLFEPRDAYEKTLKFNHYIASLIDIEKPDVLILGVPNGVMKFNNKLLEGLGFLPYIVCSAVRSDVLVLCTYHVDYTKEFYDEMSRYGMYHFGTPINYFNVANACFIPGSTGEYGTETKKKYIDLNSEFVLSKINNGISYGEHTLFNALDENSVKRACLAIHEELLSNVGYMR